jgi:pyruvate carboxylase
MSYHYLIGGEEQAGTGVATQFAAAKAGADIIDCCIDSMSGK